MFSFNRVLPRLALGLAFGSLHFSACGLAQTSVGSVPASFKQENGAATYTVPVDVPDGRAGMQPSLAFSHSTHQGNGILGMGWSLEGISAVHRCTATLAQDGFNSGIQFTDNDRYCLNGQRLIPVSGNNGGVGTEYRTEIDSYAKVLSVGGTQNNPGHFVVQTRSGQTLTLGGGTNASLIHPKGTLSWSVREVNDRTGNNPIYYSYFTDNNSHYLSKINYTGGSIDFHYEQRADNFRTYFLEGSQVQQRLRLSAVDVASPATLLHSYQLNYAVLNDPAKTSVLNTLTQCDAGGNCKPPIEFDWSHAGNQFSGIFKPQIYNTPTSSGHYGGTGWGFAGMHDVNGDGMADAVWRYGHNGGVRIAVSLAAGDGRFDSIIYNTPTASGNYAGTGWAFGGMHDVNGDGLPDAVWRYGHNSGIRVAVSLSQGDGRFGSIIYNTPTTSGHYGATGWAFAGMHDVNGDGMADAIWRYGHNGGVRVAVSLAVGDGRFGSVIYNTPTSSGNYAGTGWGFAGMHDVNGDGLPDAVWRYGHNSGIRVAVSLSQGNGRFGSIIYNTPTQNGNYAGTGWGFAGMHDVNGDGMADAIWRYGYTSGVRVAVSLATGNGRFGSVIYNTPTGSGHYGGTGWGFAGMHDVNGDGMTDAVWRYGHSGGVRVAVSLSQGNGRFGSIIYNTPTSSGNYAGTGWGFAGMHDVNGDGMPDAVWRYGYSGGVRVAVSLSQGNGRFASMVYNTPTGSGHYGGTGWGFAGMHDVNGDGKADAVWRYGYTSGVRVAVSLSGTETPQVASIKQAQGDTYQLSYRALTDPGVYTRYSGAVYPVRDGIGAQMVLAEVRKRDGVGGHRHLQYQYEGLRVHVKRNSSLGFARVIATDHSSGTRTETDYQQNSFALAGREKRKRLYASNRLIQQSDNQYYLQQSADKVYQAQQQQSVKQTFELDGSLIRTVTSRQEQLDPFGNVGKRTVVTEGNGERFTTITENTYADHAGNWVLGRLSTSKVTYQSPAADPVVRLSAFSYDSHGYLHEEQTLSAETFDPLLTKTYSYNAFGQETQTISTVAGEPQRHSRTEYNSQGQVTQVCNALNECEQFTYTPEGWRASRTGPNGLATRFHYDGFGRQILEQRADNTETRTQYVWADSGQCGALASQAYSCTLTQRSGSAAKIVQFDILGREVRTITKVFDERNIYQDTHYNALGQVSHVSREYYSGDQVYWATSEYDALGRVVRATEPDARGLPKEIVTHYQGLTDIVTVGEQQLQTSTHYNALGKVVLREEEEGTNTRYTYTSDGLLKSTRVADDSRTDITLTYDEFGRKTVQDDPDLGRWTYAYNGYGDLIRQTDANNHTLTFRYDALGRVIEKSTPEGISRWVYGSTSAAPGSVGKLLRSSGFGLTKDRQYDAFGRETQVTTTIDGQGSFVTQVSYDSLGRIQRINYPGGEHFFVEHQYNDNGFLTAVRGLRSAAQSHDLSALTPLINQAVNLADQYLAQATQLRDLGNYYRARQTQLQSLTTQDQTQLQHHADLLQARVAQGQTLSPEFYAHLNNTLEELDNIQQLLSQQAGNLEQQALQLAVLAEQTLAAADHSFQIQRTLDSAASLYAQGLQDENWINYWQAVDVDASGRISAEVYGNGIVTDYAYNQASGQLDSIHSSLLVIDPVRHLEYQYDSDNNVTLREDLVNEIEETFGYDRLQRLTDSHVTSAKYVLPQFNETQSVSYDILGNITYKTGVGAYQFGNQQHGPVHGVSAAGGSAYSYDANGNLLNGNGRTLQWNSNNKPVLISRNGKSVAFRYGPDNTRYQKTNHLGDTTLYLGKLFEQSQTAAGDTEKKHYIFAAGQLVATHAVSDSRGVQTRYLHKDALGSIDLITDAQANVVERRSFDAWGKQRSLPWQTEAQLNDPLFVTQLPFTNKGFTGQETLTEVGLIHMNGRVYDATLGRFISADPFVQASDSSQSFNRYSYVLNNPLKYTDPSGFFFKKLFRAIKKVVKKIWKPVVAIAVGVITGGAALAAIGAAASWSAGISAVLSASFTSLGSAMVAGASFGFASSFTSTLLNGGSFEQALTGGLVNGVIGGLAGGALWKVGQVLPDWFGGKIPGKGEAWFTGERVGRQLLRGAVRGGINGAAAEARGGDFKRGFATSFITDTVKWGTEALMEWRYRHEVAKYAGKKPFDEATLRAHSHTWRQAKGQPSNKLSAESVRDPRVPNVGIPRGVRPSGGFGQFTYDLTREDGYLGSLARNVPGFNNLSIAHDYWATALHVTNGGMLGTVSNLMTSQATIAPFIAGNYILLGNMTMGNYGGKPF